MRWLALSVVMLAAGALVGCGSTSTRTVTAVASTTAETDQWASTWVHQNLASYTADHADEIPNGAKLRSTDCHAARRTDRYRCVATFTDGTRAVLRVTLRSNGDMTVDDVQVATNASGLPPADDTAWDGATCADLQDPGALDVAATHGLSMPAFAYGAKDVTEAAIVRAMKAALTAECDGARASYRPMYAAMAAAARSLGQ